MATAPITPWRQYWIFQASPDRYDLLSELREEARVDWFVTRFIDQYRPGDVVFLWRAGDAPGLYGWGEVVGEVFDEGEGRKRLPVLYRQVFARPVLKTVLGSRPQVFDGLTILRNPTGANFRVTAHEVFALNGLLSELGERAPEMPEQRIDHEQSSRPLAVYLLDYRYDPDTKSILAMALEAARATGFVVHASYIVQAALAFIAMESQIKEPPEPIIGLKKILPLDASVANFSLQKYFQEAEYSVLSRELTQQLLATQTVFALLAMARRFAIHTTGREKIAQRHILGACFHGVVPPLQAYFNELLSSMSVVPADVRAQYLAYLGEHFADDNHEAWRRLMAEPVGLPPNQNFHPLITRLDSDTADEAQEDLLDIDNDAIALAKVLCARDASPPLAIGLFGEWGSGKTFFMRRLRQHVNTLTTTAGQQGETAEKVFCSKVAQIWFNAWHYQEGSLWASMVNHVFSGLKQELRRLNDAAAEDEFNALMARLDCDRVMERELAQSAVRVRELRDKNVRLESEISALQNTRRYAASAVSVEAPVSDTLINALIKYRGDIADIFGAEQAARVERLAGSGQSLKRWLTAVDGGGLKMQAVRWWRFFRRAQWQLLGLLAIMAVPAGAGAWLMREGQMMMSGLMSLITLVLGISAAHVTRFGRLLRLIGQLKRDFESAEAEAQLQREEKLEENAKRLQQLQLDKQEVAAALDAARNKHDALNAQYGRDSDEAFASFIFSRAASNDYQGELGILNTVRRDFSRLDELLRQQNDTRLPKLNRIILYIDDLDRCEPKVVVDVLQAIHLMLAFPIFMVVVGVDARWLGRALKARYPFLVHELGEPVTEDLAHAATTHDYLEKIFQIPFWLKPLDAPGAASMLRGLLRYPSADSSRSDDDTKPGGTPSSEPAQSDDGQGEERALFEETEDLSSDYEETAPVERKFGAPRIQEQLMSTTALQMSRHELDFIADLGGLVGRSPRAVKRFINVYRILKASHEGAWTPAFNARKGECRLPLTLLAALCGYPKEVVELFQVVHKGQGTLLTAARTRQSPLFIALAAALSQHNDLTCEQAARWLPAVARFGYREWGF